MFGKERLRKFLAMAYFLLIDYILIKFSFGAVSKKFWETEWFALL